MRTVIPKKSLGRLEECSTLSQPGGVRDGESIRTHKIRPEKSKDRHTPGDVQNLVSGGIKHTVLTKTRPRRSKAEAGSEVQRGNENTTEAVLKRKRHPLVLPKELPQMQNLSLDNLRSDGGTPYPGDILSAFKPFRTTCKIVRELKKDHHRILSYLKTHNRLGNWDLQRLDEAGKLSHLVLLCLSNFEVDLRKRLQKLPAPTALPEIQPPATDAELITDFRQEQWRNARDKLKLQEEKVQLTRLSPTSDGDTSRRHRLRELDRNPEAPNPVNYRTVQQESSMRMTEQLQAKKPQEFKNATDYHREDHHRTPLRRERRCELQTSSPGDIHARRRTRVQIGSSWRVPRDEESGLHHFVETQHQQKHSQHYSGDNTTVRQPPPPTWGSNENFRGRNAPKPTSCWGRPEEALMPRG